MNTANKQKIRSQWSGMWIWATYLSVIPPKKTERYNLALLVLRVALSIHKHNYTSGAGTAYPSGAPGFPAEL